MLERILIILFITLAVLYLARLGVRWARARSCGGCGAGDSSKKARRQKLTIGRT